MNRISLPLAPYDSLVVASFGGPEKKEDVLPFLRNVTKGRNIPPERLQNVAEHYYRFGGKSPINGQMRQLVSALEEDFQQAGIELPIYWGNRNWTPYLDDAVEALQKDGRKRALGFIVSAYGSYSGCRQYRENIEQAVARATSPLEVQPIRRFFNHPRFVQACSSRVARAIADLAEKVSLTPRIVFTAHSIPSSMADTCGYERQLRATASLVAQSVGAEHWDLVWQSRSGPPRVPWLEPDVLAHLKRLKANGCPAVVLAPIGFLSDHMEVVFDLDVEARDLCTEMDLPMSRALTVGTHPDFIRCIRELVLEQLNGTPPLGLGPEPIPPPTCVSTCCPAPQRRPSPATAPND